MNSTCKCWRRRLHRKNFNSNVITDNRGFGKVVCPCIDGHFSPFSLEFESNSLHSCNRELCTRANAVAGVVQTSCHSRHKLYFPFTHVDVFLTTSAILHFFYRIPIKNLIHLLSNHSQLPSSPPTKLPLLPPSSPWRGCSRTPFGRRNRHSIVVGTPIILVGVPVCLFFEVPYLPIRLLN